MSEQPLRSYTPVAAKSQKLRPRVDQRVVALLIRRSGLGRCDVVEPVYKGHRGILEASELRHEFGSLQLAASIYEAVGQVMDGFPSGREDVLSWSPTTVQLLTSTQLNLIRLARDDLGPHDVIDAYTQGAD